MDAITKSFNSEALNIGLVTETYPPEVNGVAMTLSRLVDGLAQHKHRITLYRPKPLHGLTSTTASHEQVFLPGLPIPGYSEMHFGLPAGRFFTKYWHAHRTDILYVATEGPLGASAIRAARRLGIPVISGFHTNFHTYSRYYQFGRLSPLIFRYLRRLHNSTDMTLVPTRMLAEKLKGQGFDRVNVMQRGVDTTLFTPDRRCGNLGQLWQADNDTLVCLYVGRIAAEKNIGQAIETYEALKTHYKVRFVLVGDGPLREHLQASHPDYIFCGTLLGDRLARHFASADVLLFPSRSETYGNVVTEAMASGLAVVAYDEAAAHEHIKDGQNGVLAADSTTQNFTTVAMRLCKQPSTIRRIGTNAAAHCRDLGWPSIVGQFESLLFEACRPAKPRPNKLRTMEARP